MFTVSINPSYLCNFRCDFCYLTKEQLGDPKRASIPVIMRQLFHILEYRTITHIDLYGGEVTALPSDYINELLDSIKEVYEGKVNVITNLSRPLAKTQWLLRDDVDVSVSWDYTCREGWDTVMKNMALLPKPIHLLMLAGECMTDWTDEEIGASQLIINALANIASVEIKPYSTNQANQDKVSFADFENFIKRWTLMLELTDPDVTYEFVNRTLMDAAVEGRRNAWSDDHLYITPDGKLGVLEFDENDDEFFLELDNYSAYEKWAVGEKEKVLNNAICSKCPYLGTCLSEHLRDVKSLDYSCNGFRFLLDWHVLRTS